MEDPTKLLTELAKRLAPPLAFAALAIVLLALYGERIPESYRPAVYLLIIGGFLVYALVTIARIRRSGEPERRDVQVAEGVKESVIATGDKNLIVQIVNQYAASSPGVQKEELQRQVEQYLEWAQENFGTIVLRGIEQGGRQVVSLPLESVYVPLRAETQEEARQDWAEMEKRAAGAEARQRENISLSQVLSLGKRVIITGGPGSGKTVLLQHMAWTLAAALSSGRSALAREKLGLASPLPLPIYVPLSLYAAYLRNLPKEAGGRERALATFISDYLLQRQTNLELSANFFAHLLRDGRQALLLLDGLDEVPDEAQRARVRQAIEDLASGRDALRLVVTSRTAAYHGEAVLGRGFRPARVLPLGAEQIEALVRQAYRCIYPASPAQAQSRAGDLLEGIRSLEAERRRRLGESAEALVNSPLMVRMLLIVHFNERKLPDQRADLYQKAVDAMLRPDYALDQAVTDEIERQVAGSLAMGRDMLQRLAFHMHRQGQQQGREIEEDALRRTLAGEPTYEPYIDGLIAQTRQRGTLLEERGGLYRFIHLSFQEFLAGRYLAQNYHDPGAIARFFAESPILESWWREPALLLAGYLDISEPVRARRLLLRLAGLDEAAGEREPALSPDVDLAMAETAASACLECRSQAPDLGEKLRSRLQELLVQVASTTAGAAAKAAPRNLAAAGDALDRLGWLPQDLYTFVRIPAGAAPSQEFWIARYPVTNVQYARFAGADDYLDPAMWQDFPRFDEKCQPLGDWGEAGWKWYEKPLDYRTRQASGVIYPIYWDDPRFGIARRGAPVVGVSWFEANAYCRWLLRHWAELEEEVQNPALRPGAFTLRLPLEVEWVAAAGGDQPPERFPWDLPGEVTRDEAEILRRANVNESGIGRTTSVGLYPLGESQPFKLWDLASNVWEWQANYSSPSYEYLGLRGGSWLDGEMFARLPERDGAHPEGSNFNIGFRVAAARPGV